MKIGPSFIWLHLTNDGPAHRNVILFTFYKAQPTAMDAGTRIGHYQIVSHLGGGGMGVVYKARDTTLDRFVALKFLPPELGSDEDANRRFMQEAKAASALDHPNICTIYEVGQAAEGSEFTGRLYISMAFYDGVTLKKRLSQGQPVAPSEAVDIAAQIAEGLAAAHRREIVHRDIKPANVIVTQDGLVKILDFGLAKLAGGLALTRSGTTLGTAAYMAPEQLRAQEVDHRADLWSLGVVLAEMLTGQKPFKGEYEQALAYSILNSDPEIGDVVSSELRTVVERLLAKDPDSRFESAADVASALKQVPESRPSPAPPHKSEQGIRIPVRIIAAVAATVAILVVAWILLRPSANGSDNEIDTNTIAVMPFSVRGDPDLDYLREGAVDLLSVKLDGAGSVRSVDANAVLGTIAKDQIAVETPADAIRLANQLGAGRAILGSVVRVGQDIRLSASLYERESEPNVTATVSAASEDELTSSLDALVREIVGEMLQDPQDESRSLAAVTTGSLPALKSYLKGEQAIRKGQWHTAMNELKAAVDQDSTFALAWSRLAYAAGWRSDILLEFRAYEKALANRGPLPDRMKKMVEADYYGFKDGQADRAFRLYREILSSYPNDVYALERMGEMTFHYNPLLARSQAPSEEYFERVLKLAPDRGDNRLHLLDLALEFGEHDRIDSLAAEVLEGRPDPSIRAQVEESLEIRKRIEGDSSWSFTIDPDMTSGAVSAVFLVAASNLEDISAAREVLEAAAEEEHFTDNYRQWSRFRMRRLDAAEGKLRDFKHVSSNTTPRYAARRIITSSVVYGLPVYAASDSLLQSIRDEIVAWDTLSNPTFRDFSGQNAFLGDYHITKAYLLALLDFRMGDQSAFDEGRTYLEVHADSSLRVDPEAIPWRGRGRHLAHALLRTLDALDFWRKGQLEEAIEASIDARMPILWRATNLSILYAQVIRRFVLGQALLESGRLEESREAFRSLTAAGHSEGLYFLGPVYLRLADIHERLGEPDKALEFYARILRLWKDCDPELVPLRDEAKRNLDRLVEAGIREPVEQ